MIKKHLGATMKVFLFEYATCGAFPELDASLTVEGLGMFKALLEGFEGEVITFIDKRIPLEGYPKVDSHRQMFSDCLETADVALVIAPEPEMEYYNLVLELEKAGCANLGPSSEAVKDTTDKYLTFKKLKGVRTPKTIIYDGKHTDVFPLVAKPRDGVSSEGIFLVQNENDLEKVPEGYLLQEYIPGRPCSAGMLVGDEIRILSINTQELENFAYQGAVVPAPIELNAEDEEQLLRAVERFRGLHGYVGVDFVYNDGVVIIELNARPTTSIIAMREAYGYNLAELILKNHLREQIPEGSPRRRVTMRKHSASGRSGEKVFVEFGGYSISLASENLGGDA